MTARQIIVPGAMPSRDANGRALPAKFRFYMPGTTTPKTVYTDNTLTVAHPFPILSDASGRWPSIWADDAQSFDVGWSDQVYDRTIAAFANVSPAADAVLASVALADAAADECEAVLAELQPLSDQIDAVQATADELVAMEGTVLNAAASAASSAASIQSAAAIIAAVAAGTGSSDLLGMLGAGLQVAGAGDSIMYGLTSPNTLSPLNALKAYYGPLSLSTYTNDGVPGARLKTNLTSGSPAASDMVARYTANIYPKRPAATGALRSLLTIIIGANDFPVIADTEVATWCSVLDAYCAQARTDGFEVYVHTIMPRTTGINATVQANERRAKMNDFIRRMRNADGIVDLALLFPDPTTGDFIDGTHPTDNSNKLIGRAEASVIARRGLTTPTNYPAATQAPVLTKAETATLERACLVATATTTPLLLTSPTAIASGDYSFSAWVYWASTNTLNNVTVFNGAAGQVAFGVVFDATTKLGKIYVLPLTSPNYSPANVFADSWNHVAAVRSGTTLTYYLNGVAIGSVTDANSQAAITQFSAAVQARIARTRTLSRAYSAAEVAAEYARLSEFDAGETAYLLAQGDGPDNRGNYIDDLSASGAHIYLPDTSKAFLKRPGARGRIQRTTTGNSTFLGVPTGARIVSWIVDVAASGGGAVNLSDGNGTGKFFNSTLATGRTELTLLSRFPTASQTIFCNAVSYTITHTITWERV